MSPASSSQENTLDQEEDVDLEGQGEDQLGTETTDETTSGSPGSGSSGQDAPAGSPAPQHQYQHPLLKGKSPAEIEALLAAQIETTQSLTRELNQRHQEQPAAPAPKQEEDDAAAAYGDDFMAPKLRTLEDRLAKKLEQAVAPLREEVTKTRGDDVRSRLRKEFKHFEVLEPTIDMLLREQKQNPLTASEQQLKLLYHTAVGYANEKGIDLGRREAAPAPENHNPPKGEEQPPMGIPQHRPSGAPLPAARGPKKRELNEEERRLARQYFPDAKNPEEEYRKFQEADEDSVVEPGFSKGNW